MSWGLTPCWRWIVNDACGEKDVDERTLILFGCGWFIHRYTILNMGENTLYEAWDEFMVVKWVDSKTGFTNRDLYL